MFTGNEIGYDMYLPADILIHTYTPRIKLIQRDEVSNMEKFIVCRQVEMETIRYVL